MLHVVDNLLPANLLEVLRQLCVVPWRAQADPSR